MEKATCNFSFCAKPQVIEVETDLLLIGGGMACCGAAYEAARWATPKGIKITMVDKAATDRSGAVAMGLSAINTYVGENKPEDYVKYVRADLMGIIREDLDYDLGRHVDDSVHLFEEWGLPIWKKGDDGFSLDGFQARDAGKAMLKDGGTPVRSGKWQIMINGESYKVIVAEAAKKALEYNRAATGVDQNLFERVFIVKLYHDANDPKRVAAAAGFSVRENKIYVFKAKAMLNAAGGAVNVFRPRSTKEGQGRAWYPVWNSGSGYALGMQAGAEMTLMENRFVPARFKDGYGPVGAWFLFFKAKATNALGEDYCANKEYLAEAQAKYGKYVDAMGTAIRNHLMMKDMKAGKGPILMRTHEAMDAINKQFVASPRREGRQEEGQAPRGRGLGGLPRHGDRPGRSLGFQEHRARQDALRDHADRALPARLARRLRRLLVLRPRRHPRHPRPLLLGLQPDVDRAGPVHGRRRLRRLRAQVLLGLARRGAHRRQVRPRVHPRPRGLQAHHQGDGRRDRRRALPALRGLREAQELHHRPQDQPALHQARHAPGPAAEDRRRVLRRLRHLVHDLQDDARRGPPAPRRCSRRTPRTWRRRTCTS